MKKIKLLVKFQGKSDLAGFKLLKNLSSSDKARSDSSAYVIKILRATTRDKLQRKSLSRIWNFTSNRRS